MFLCTLLCLSVLLLLSFTWGQAAPPSVGKFLGSYACYVWYVYCVSDYVVPGLIAWLIECVFHPSMYLVCVHLGCLSV